MFLGVNYQRYRYFVRNGFKYWNSYDPDLECIIIEEFIKHNEKAGAWEISMHLKAQGINVGRRRVKRYLDFNQLKPNIKEDKRKSFDKPIDTTWSQNHVKDFNIEKVNEVWAHDNAEFKCLDGKLNVLGLQDLASRACIDLQIEPRAFKGEDIVKLIAINLVKENVQSEIIIMADNGTEGKNKHVSEFAKHNNIKLSYSAPGMSWENGVVESLFKTAKKEISNDIKKMTMKEATEYIRNWFLVRYNTQRYHSYKNLIPSVLKQKLQQI